MPVRLMVSSVALPGVESRVRHKKYLSHRAVSIILPPAMLPFPLQRPIAFFDIESTGTNAWNDRIIDLAIVRLEPDSTVREFSYRVNPGCPIPPEASQIHHITDDDVRESPIFANIAAHVRDALADCDLAGFNSNRFDIPMLQEEFKRAEMEFSLEGRRLIDMQRIYHKREPRTLQAALRFFCGEELTDAHSAMADTRASLKVLIGQFARYPDLPRDIDKLNDYCSTRNPRAVDSTGKLIWVGNDVVINFGRRKGQALRVIVQNEKSFVRWLLNADFPPDVKDIVEKASRGVYPPPPAGLPAAEGEDEDVSR